MMMTTTIRLLFVLLVTAATSFSATGATNTSTTTTCTIDCLHDTECVEGKANFTWHPADPSSGEAFDFNKELSRDGWHCGCPPGLTGLRCGRKYESCNDGNHVCYNEGQCIATLKDIYQNEQQYCDCKASVNEAGNTIRYSGKYCEVEVVHKSTRCTEDNNICQNGGTCKKTVDEIDPCDCPEGYIGRMCEFFQPSVPKCTLKCEHGGSCRYGTKTEDHTLVLNEPNGPESQNVQVVHQDYQYCECPTGFMGNLCDNEETLCGNIKCRHGSKCISVDNKDTGETTHHCSCTEINKQKLSKGEDVQFSGRHCEIKSTSVCHYESTATTFCTHNGTCPEKAHQDCSCLTGYQGPHCGNHETGESQPDTSQATCALQCKNGGHCRKGSKNDEHVQDLLDKYGSELGHLGLNVTHTKDVEHCACPDGYVGLECEYSMKTCGKDGSEHPCFAGSDCTMVNGIPTCICESADTAAAGIYCQHKPSATCSIGNKAETNGNRGFCTNEGVCVTNKEGEAACRCHSQFEGPHCEYGKNATTTKALTSSTNNGSGNSSGLGGTAKLGVVLAVMICATVVAFGVVTYRRKKVITADDVAPVYPDLDGSLALDDMSLRSAPVVDVGPEKDFDGNELKDVEFI